MNPQQPGDGQNGPLPPQTPNPQQPYTAPPQPYVTIPGQGPQSVAPLQPVKPEEQHPLDHSPYEFILNPAQANAKKPLAVGVSSGSTMKRVGVAVGGLVVLIILGVIVSSILGSGGKGKTVAMTAVAQEQTELIRIAELGAKNSVQQKTQNLALNVQVSMESANSQLLSYLKSNGQKVDAKTLALKHNTEDDTSLTNALANSTYDTTFIGVMQKDLNTYGQLLQAAYKTTPGPKGEALIKNQLNGAGLLFTQSKD